MLSNKWLKWGLVSLVVIIIGIIFLLSMADNFLVTQTNLKKADAIVVISGGRGERVQHATQLFREGYADMLIISGCPGNAPSIAQAYYMQKTAVDSGVPADCILLDVLDNHNQGTGVQAVNVRKMLNEHGFDSIILVTTDFHTNRAKLIFNRAFKGLDIDLQVSHPVKGVFEYKNWWKKQKNLVIVFSEMVKYVWYWISY